LDGNFIQSLFSYFENQPLDLLYPHVSPIDSMINFINKEKKRKEKKRKGILVEKWLQYNTYEFGGRRVYKNKKPKHTMD